MRVIAKLNYLHISPRKVRAVVNIVKKMKPREALAQLKFTPNLAAHSLAKLIESALANASNNFSLDVSGLKIFEFKVDGGPVFKRFRPGSRGRVSPLRRKTSHITLILEGQRVAAANVKKTPELPAVESVSAPEKTIEIKTSDLKKNRENFQKQGSPKKGPGFVKRMFQRKSI